MFSVKFLSLFALAISLGIQLGSTSYRYTPAGKNYEVLIKVGYFNDRILEVTTDIASRVKRESFIQSALSETKHVDSSLAWLKNNPLYFVTNKDSEYIVIGIREGYFADASSLGGANILNMLAKQLGVEHKEKLRRLLAPGGYSIDSCIGGVPVHDLGKGETNKTLKICSWEATAITGSVEIIERRLVSEPIFITIFSLVLLLLLLYSFDVRYRKKINSLFT